MIALQDVIVRQLMREDMPESVRMGEYCFHYELSEEQRIVRAEQTDPSSMLGLFVEGKLASRLMVHSMRIYVQGRLMDMGGVAGVATWPEYRGRGAADKLMRAALASMREVGQTVSLLHPFRFAYYRKLGWELLSEYRMYECPPAILQGLGGKEYTTRRTDDWRVLDTLYTRYAMRYNGMLQRDEAWWKKLLAGDSAHRAVCYDGEGKPQGYVRYKASGCTMIIYELVPLVAEARLSLLGYIGAHCSLIDAVKLRSPIVDPLLFLLAEPGVKHELKPDFMARIVDIESFLKQYRFQSGGSSGSLLLQVTDSAAAWNNGSFLLEINAAGVGSCSRCNDSASQRPAIEADIGAWTAMLLGVMRPSMLRECGRLTASDHQVSVLERFIPAMPAYFADSY
ncbi:GNAT family N-acetyltransferase [Paenibacillus chungangensis]|uniref:Enhanced intracellular survival protein Eis n=1 Tax=Paenibacillus chungangensis TaxID=696535 RepID=A0ABW3HTP9_9BACL